MNNTNSTSRRAFFVRGGAALGAGVAAAGAGATPAVSSGAGADAQLLRQLAAHADREAIRSLAQTFLASVEGGDTEAAAALFDEAARLRLVGETVQGGGAIRALLAAHARHELSAVHVAYRQRATQPEPRIALAEDGQGATASFVVEVDVATPLRADCTAAQMARLQGNVAGQRSETGRFAAQLVRRGGAWKLAALEYHSV